MFTDKFFKKYGLTPEKLKSIFTKVVPDTSGNQLMKSGKSGLGEGEKMQKDASGASPAPPAVPTGPQLGGYGEKIAPLIRHIHSRIRDGINRNLVESRIYWAIDKAYDVGFQQIPPTLIESLMDRDVDSEKVTSTLNEWGLGYLLTPAPCSCNATPCSCGAKDKKMLNLPSFFRVFVPLVKSYVGIRWAKIYSDRNVYPLYKFEPMRSTVQNRLRADIITDRVQMMATQLGYHTVMRQEVFQALLYSFAFSFPKESWYVQEGDFIADDNTKTRVKLKEGLRYNIPHPSRVFIDPSDRASTFNTDSGCKWAAYWNVITYKDVRNSDTFWNKDYVGYGNNWITQFPTYFQEIFPCSVKFPSPSTNSTGVDGAVTTNQNQLRDERMSSYYTATDDDKAVVLTEYFEKLNPKDYGLSTYDGELWFRFVVASDDTIIYCEPLPYCPVIYTGYDADENRARNASLALEVMPFQDHIGNLLSQYILSVKQNLEKVVFYNTDVVDVKDIDKLKNLGEKRYRTISYMPFSGRESIMVGQTGPQNAFMPVTFPIQNTQEIATSISAIINILERLLALSSQELGQPASHEQTAQESVIIANNVTTRLGFTASFVDDAAQARKVQLYNALMCFGSDEVYAQIESDSQITKSVLDSIGFTAVESTATPATPTSVGESHTSIVKGPKTALILEGFVSNREGEQRINGPHLVQAMANFIASFANGSSILLQVLGPEQTVALFNQMATMAGFPRDFRLKANPQGPDQMGQQLQALQQQVGQAIAQSRDSVLTDVAKAMAPMQQALQQLQSSDQSQTQALSQLIQKLQGVAGLAPEAPPPQDASLLPQPMPGPATG